MKKRGRPVHGWVIVDKPLGLTSTLALAFSLARRLRELVWVAIGLGAFAVLRAPARQPPAARAPLAPPSPGGTR